MFTPYYLSSCAFCHLFSVSTIDSHYRRKGRISGFYLPLVWQRCLFQEDEAKGLARCFYGGFLTTCGLTYMGSYCTDEGKALGQHGLISNVPANHVGSAVRWEGDTPSIQVSGQIKQAQVFGEHLVMSRVIRLDVERNVFTIEDEIENRGLTRTPYMILYHMNYGYPMLNEGCVVEAPGGAVAGRDQHAQNGLHKWMQMELPADDMEEQCYYHMPSADADGFATYTVSNSKLGIAVHVRYTAGTLPFLTEWKCRKSGVYALGLEPGNARGDGRGVAREDGSLQFLEPLERRFNRICVKIEDLIGNP